MLPHSRHNVMSKLKTPETPSSAAPQVAGSQAAGSQQGFMAALGKLAQPFTKPDMPSDPIARLRTKFIVNLDATIKALADGTPKSKWHRKLPDGKFVLSFRNANSAMDFNGSRHFQVADVAAANALLEAAMVAVVAGELDTALLATQRQPPMRKKKAEAPAA